MGTSFMIPKSKAPETSNSTSLERKLVHKNYLHISICGEKQLWWFFKCTVIRKDPTAEDMNKHEKLWW